TPISAATRLLSTSPTNASVSAELSRDVSVAATDLSFHGGAGGGARAKPTIGTVLKAKVHNNSAPGASVGVRVRFLIDGKMVDERPCFLDSKEIKEVSTIWVPPVSPYVYLTEPKDLTWPVTYQVIVDPENKVLETNESNNAASITIPVECGGWKELDRTMPPGPHGDLSIGASDLRFNPRDRYPLIYQGDHVSPYWTVHSQSSENLTQKTHTEIYLDDELIEVFTTAFYRDRAQERGIDDYPVQYTRKNPLKLRVVADADNNLEETNEDNNEATRNIPIIVHDVSVSVCDVSWSPSLAKPGSRLNIKVQVHNNGGHKDIWQIPLRVRLLVNGEMAGEVSAKESAPLGEVSFIYQVPAVQTTPLICQVVLDPDDLIAESNEDNNQVTVQVPVAVPEVQHDTSLSFSISTADMGFLPQPLVPGRDVTLWAAPRNSSWGTLPSGSKLRVLFKVDGRVIWDTSILASSLPPQQYHLLQKQWKVPQAQTKDPVFEVVLDPDGALSDGNRADNVASTSLRLARPDLVVTPTNLSSEPNPPLFGQTARLRATVANDGLGPAPESRVRFNIDGQTVAERFISVPAFGAVSVEADWTVPASLEQSPVLAQMEGHSGRLTLPAEPSRTITYEVSVDPDNIVEELSKDNNKASRSYQVRMPRRTGTVYVSVLDNTMGEGQETPASGVSVTLRSGEKNATAITDSSGWCTFYGVPFGLFDVSASRDGFHGAEAIDSLPNYAWSRTVNLDINNKGMVVGTVISTDHGSAAPLGGVSVRGPGVSLLTFSDGVNKGKFSVSLPPGQHTLMFSKDGYTSVVKQVTVEPLGQHTLDVDMKATTYASVRGTVRDAAGNPVANASVTPSIAQQGTPVAQPSTQTDANGQYSLRINLPDGMWQWAFLRATKVGLPDGVAAEQMVRGRDYVLDIEMKPPGYSGSRSSSTDVCPWTIVASMPGTFWNPDYDVTAIYGKFQLNASVQIQNSVVNNIAVSTQPDFWYYFGVKSSWQPAEVFTNDEIGKTQEAENIKAGATLAAAVLPSIPIAATGHSSNLTRATIKKVALESNGVEVWSIYPDTNGSVDDSPNTGINWDNFRVKFYVQVDPTGSSGGEGFEPTNPLAGYGRDKVLLKWNPKSNKFTNIGTYVSRWNEIQQRFEYTDRY
ncbi:MAG: CARDB domain-containing protein, partial [Chloroflexota bacterium]